MTQNTEQSFADRTKGNTTMTAQSAQTKLLMACIDSNTPVLLMGAPGTAKTATIEALAAERGNVHLEVVIASAQDPTTILGIPMPSADRKYTEGTVPGWARRIQEAHAQGMETWLFMDELTSVPPIVAGPLLGVIQSRRSDSWTLPGSTRIIAAANPPDLAVGGYALQPAMANRWTHLTWNADADAWTAWADAQDSPTLHDIADFIRAMGPAHLLAVPTDKYLRSGAWPSPRSWTNGARLADALGDTSALALSVGETAARTFDLWLSKRDIPTSDELRAGTKELPTRPDQFRTCLDALAGTVTDDNLGSTLAVLRKGIAIDAGAVADSTLRIARAGHARGLAEVVSDLRAAGIDFGRLAAAAGESDGASR